MSALRPAFFILNLESFISRLNVILCHDLTLSVGEPDNAAAKQGQELRSEQTVTHIHEQHNLYLFLRLNNSEIFVELVGTRPLHLLSQTVLPLKSPTGAFIAQLRFANAVPPQTLLRLFTANWKLSVIKYQQQIPLSNDSPVRVCLYWNCALLLLSTSKEFSYCDAMLCCTVYTNQRDLVCRISATPDT